MLRVMVFKGYFPARRDTVRKLSFFCSRILSTMRRLYLRACEKTMLSFHLSVWLEWKCKSAAQSVGFLYRLGRVCGPLLCGSSCLGRKSLGWSVQR